MSHDNAYYAELFDVRESVIENLHEDYEIERELYQFECEDFTFFAFLVEQFAQAHYLFAAIDGGDVLDCLEAYDNAYDHYAPNSDDN